MSLEQLSSKISDHKYLLEETIHVANASQVSKAGIASGGLEPLTLHNDPILKFSRPPKPISMKFPKRLYNGCLTHLLLN